jgi:hypothetical protein
MTIGPLPVINIIAFMTIAPVCSGRVAPTLSLDYFRLRWFQSYASRRLRQRYDCWLYQILKIFVRHPYEFRV